MLTSQDSDKIWKEDFILLHRHSHKIKLKNDQRGGCHSPSLEHPPLPPVQEFYTQALKMDPILLALACK